MRNTEAGVGNFSVTALEIEGLVVLYRYVNTLDLFFSFFSPITVEACAFSSCLHELLHSFAPPLRTQIEAH